MNKQEFFKELKFALRRAEYADVEAVLDYYDEIILERKERGESEENIIASFDSVEKIASNVEKEQGKIEKKKTAFKATEKAVDEPGPRNYGKAVGKVLTLPITLPFMILLFAFVIIIASLTFAACVTIWAVCVSLIAGGLGLVAGGIITGIAAGSWLVITGLIGGGLIVFATGLLGLRISTGMTKAVLKISAKLLRGTAKLFTKKKVK